MTDCLSYITELKYVGTLCLFISTASKMLSEVVHAGTAASGSCNDPLATELSIPTIQYCLAVLDTSCF